MIVFVSSEADANNRDSPASAENYKYTLAHLKQIVEIEADEGKVEKICNKDSHEDVQVAVKFYRYCQDFLEVLMELEGISDVQVVPIDVSRPPHWLHQRQD